MSNRPSHLDEICAHCGLPKGAHHAGSSPWPYDYCPGHEGRMDWENGGGTTFSPTGLYKDREYGRVAKNLKKEEEIYDG